ncbi:MAG: TcmI family type II polyketide cyclase [Solirubrobacterales bacterium]|nr:TcmI family type II polyketide cyclase [Solirubrobacterales bacterium]
MSIQRGVIVARIKPGSEQEVARIFGESDATELPRLTGVRHRSLYVLDDVYIHLVETDDEFAAAVENVRDHALFKDISRKLDAYITPFNPETWRSPKDAQARQFYSWEPEQ